jgi:hypothetical protein
MRFAGGDALLDDQETGPRGARLIAAASCRRSPEETGALLDLAITDPALYLLIQDNG